MIADLPGHEARIYKFTDSSFLTRMLGNLLLSIDISDFVISKTDIDRLSIPWKGHQMK